MKKLLSIFLFSLLALNFYSQSSERPFSKDMKPGEKITLEGHFKIYNGAAPNIRFVTEYYNEVVAIGTGESSDNEIVEYILKKQLENSFDYTAEVELKYTESVNVQYYKNPLMCFSIENVGIREISYCENSTYRIDGEKKNRQVFDKNNNQITGFSPWERVDGLYVSPDESKMLVWHRPDKAKAYLITLYDLKTKTIIAECEPGWSCFGVIWTPDYLVYKWATTGGGCRFEYRSYKTLKIIKTVICYLPFEDLEDNVLICANYFYDDKDIIICNLSDAKEIKKINVFELLKQKGISAEAISVQNILKTADKKYSLSVGYYLIDGEGSDTYQTDLIFEL